MQREIMKVCKLVRTAARMPKKEMREKERKNERETECSKIGHGVIERALKK